MGQMRYALELSLIFFLVFFNGLLAMAEIAIVSSRKARLHQWADEGDEKAQLALSLANSPTDFLSTIQVGITLVGILAGAIGEAAFAGDLHELLMSVPPISPYARPIALGLVVTAITFLSLIFGELVPKRFALHSPEKIARLVARPMKVLSELVMPVVKILGTCTNLVLRLAGIREHKEQPVSEAELQVLVDQATEAGVLEEAEQEMLASVLRLGDQKVSSLMTPRPDIVWIELGKTEAEVLDLIESNPHARFPVAENSLDHTIGVVESKTLLRLKMRGQDIDDLRSLVIQPAYVPENMTALELLEEFRNTKQKLAIVLDEYGGLQGIVTREDIFRNIVGDLPIVGEAPKWEATERDDGSWLLDAQIPNQSFKEIFDLDKLAGEDEADFQTLAGFILYQLEHIPQTGEHFEMDGLRYEVVDMDRHKIDKVLVSRVVQEAEKPEPSKKSELN